MQDLNISLVQTKLHWEDPSENLEMLSKKMSALKNSGTHLIVLPEMFNTGFSMNAKNLAESMDGQTVNWMQKKAAELNVVIVGSLIINEQGKYFNRLIWMRPDGTYETYDKKHLFRLSDEPNIYSAGDKKLIVELNGWKICPQICYDLRFPVWNRNAENYDLLLFVANWPERRNTAWKTLLLARAIENQSYVVGLNRVGADGNEAYHSGDSGVIDPMGDVLWQEPDKEVIKTVILSASHLKSIREKLPFLQDGDAFEVK